MDICALQDIPHQGARFMTIGEKQIAIFKSSEGEIFAIDNACPHKRGPLSEGIVHGEFVTCPLHNWVISLRTGEAQGADKGCVARYNVQIINARVILEWP